MKTQLNASEIEAAMQAISGTYNLLNGLLRQLEYSQEYRELLHVVNVLHGEYDRLDNRLDNMD